MKRILLFILLFSGASLQAQSTQDTIRRDTSINKWVYCEIVGMNKLLSQKLNVVVDYGQARGWFSDMRIRTDEGKVQSFNSMVDAMNYLGDQGWEFVQAYAVTMGSSNVYHWLLKAEKNGPVFFPPTKKQ